MSDKVLSIGCMLIPAGLRIFVVNARYGMHAPARQSGIKFDVLTSLDGAVCGTRGMVGVMD